MLALGALAFLNKQVVSALSSCESWSKSLWHTNSIAVMKSTFGGLLGAFNCIVDMVTKENNLDLLAAIYHHCQEK